MKSIRINKTVLATLLLTLAFTTSVYAWGPGGRYYCCGYSNDSPEETADLTSEQQEQLATLRQQFIDDTAESRIALNTAAKNLDILMETSEPDKKAINALIKEITDLEATLLEKRINHRLEVKKVAPGLASGKKFQRCPKTDRNDSTRDGRKTAFSPGGCGPCPPGFCGR